MGITHCHWPIEDIPFPDISQLRGPLNEHRNIFVCPASFNDAPIWYKYVSSSRNWEWTPYKKFQPWISVENIIIPSGSREGTQPSARNKKLFNI